MKVLELLLKILFLVLLFQVRAGELDVDALFVNFKYRQNIAYYIDAFAGIAIFLLLLDFVQFIVIAYYKRRHRVRGSDNFIVGINNIYTIVLVIGLGFGVLSLFKIKFHELFTALSIIFAGLVILTKDYVSNMINGMIITFSDYLSINDHVRIGVHKGKIVDINLQNICLVNEDEDAIFIPNNTVFNSEVLNYTKRQIKKTTIEFDIDIKYLSNVDDLEAKLIDSLKSFHEHIRPDSYYLRVSQIEKDSVLLKFQFSLMEPNKDLEREIRRSAVRKIVELISEREKRVDGIQGL